MKSRVHNAKYLEKYFTQFPNIIDDSDLTPFEYRLLIHYYRVGECWEGVRKTSEICKMSTGKVAECRKALEEKGFVTIETDGIGIIINLVDLSERNLAKYSKTTVQEVNTTVQEVNTTVQEVNDNCSGGEHKNNHVKKNPLRTISPDGDLFQNVGINSESHPEENKKEKTKSDECYGDFVRMWTEAYPELGFDDVSGKKIKSLIKRTRMYISSTNKVPTKENVNGMFQYVLNYARIPQNDIWANGQDITVFDQKYLAIVRQIKIGKKVNHSQQNSSSVFSKYRNTQL